MKQREEHVILVDEQDHPIGLMPKMEAHEKGRLHRAFSVFVLNERHELLLQQRAMHKYHSPGLWTNSCCSHQRDKESTVDAGFRRLKEEMGFAVPVKEVFSFIYKVPFDNGLTEHEFDHVLVGYYNGGVKPHPEEAMGYRWQALSDIKRDMAEHPERFTAWFRIIFDRFYDYTLNNIKNEAGEDES